MEQFDQLSGEPVDLKQSDWDVSDRRAWVANGVACTTIIALTDASLVNAAVWLAGTLMRAYHGMPLIARTARRVSDAQKSFYLDVAIGWSLYPGPLVGSFFGVLAPTIWNLPVSSFQGGLIGLIVGPLIAVVLGLLLATLVLGAYTIFTGRRRE